MTEAGASTLNIPDTVGYAIPSEFGALVGRVRERIGDNAVISVHCHNDLGLATANTLAAVQAGARQVEVTINGLGERAGNASLEEVVMALRTRPGQFPQLAAGVQTEQLTPAAGWSSYLTGFAVQPNKAIVGSNAFAHESGIHQDGYLKNPLTYEIMTPQSVGLRAARCRSASCPAGAGSRASSGSWASTWTASSSTRSTGRRSRSPTRRRRSPTRTCWRSSTSARATCRGPWSSSAGASAPRPAGTRWARCRSSSRARQGRQRDRQRPRQRAVQGRRRGGPPGPPLGPVLTEYEIKAVSAGEDAQGQVLVRCRRSSDEGPGALVVTGHGLRTNIIEASLEAYLVAANKLHGAEINGIEVAFVGGRTAEELP